MKKTILTIAAILTTSLTVFGSAAEAGGNGVRLKFNGRLGSFVARPSRGHVAKKSNHRAYKTARAAKIAKIRKAKIAAARKAKIAQIRKAKIAAARKAKYAAAKKAAVAKKRRFAALNRTAKARAEARRLAAAQEVRETEERVQADEVAGVSENEPTTTSVTETTDAVNEVALPEVVVEDDAKETNVADASKVTPPTPTASPDRDITCKKFIPSAGMTITVPCQD